MTTRFVLDASVVVKWFFVDESEREAALRIRNSLVQHPEHFVVPNLFHSELIHVLSRKSARDLDFVTKALDVILSLGIRTAALSQEGLHLAARFCSEGMSGYDATYAALAHENAAKWLTADLKAVKHAGPKFALALTQFS